MVMMREGVATAAAPAEDWDDFAHTGPGTLAGRYLRCFWHPVYLAQSLPPGQARPIRIMSEDFTLYRGESGTPHLLDFRCAHRGTQLSTGWVEGDDLRCFYHGWRYDPSGQCTEQPAEPEPFCQRIRIRSYPTQEYLGLIFAYLGEGEPPPLPRYPDLEVEGVIETDSYVQPCNFFQTLENDPVHGAFVHRKPNLPKGVYGDFPAVSAEETDWGFAEHRRWLDGEFRTSQHGMPNIRHNMKRQRTIPPMPEVGWCDSLYWRVPLDDEHVIQFTVDLVHATGEQADVFRVRRAAWLAKEGEIPPGMLAERVLSGDMCPDDLYPYAERTAIVNAQDYVAQVGQGAIADRSLERLGRVDAGLILFRKLWQRELRALAEGRPIKRWERPVSVRAETSQYASSTFDHGRRRGGD
jgi:5,5'-dehydrodivanillate O-demethylase